MRTSTPLNFESEMRGTARASISALLKSLGSWIVWSFCSVPLRYAICKPDAPLKIPFLPKIKYQNISCLCVCYRFTHSAVYLRSDQFSIIKLHHKSLNYLSYMFTIQGLESLRTKKSETLGQVQRYVEMMQFLPFGNPLGYRFQGAFGNSIQSTREVDQWAGFLYLWEQNIVWFFFTRRTSRQEKTHQLVSNPEKQDSNVKW